MEIDLAIAVFVYGTHDEFDLLARERRVKRTKYLFELSVTQLVVSILVKRSKLGLD